MFIFLRLTFMVDLPVKTINEFEVISVSITRLTKQILNVFPVSYDLKYHIYNIATPQRMKCFFAIWLIGFIFLVGYDIYKSYNIRRLYQLSETNCFQNDNTIGNIIRTIEQEYKKKIDLTIYCNEDINVPFVIGLRKPSIFINPKIFSKLQLYYIFKHEIVHIVNRDNWIKMFIHVFVSFYWWIPFLWLIPDLVDEACEYRCDKKVSQNMDTIKKIEYSSLINMVSSEALLFKKKHLLYSAFALKKQKDRIYERIHVIVKPQKSSKLFVIPFYSIYICVLMCSLLFSFPTVIQSDYSPSLPETISVSPDNSYLILNTDGTYSLYTYDMLIDSDVKNVDELNLPIK